MLKKSNELGNNLRLEEKTEKTEFLKNISN